MIFDFEFLKLELEAAKTGNVPSELTSHPVFQALIQHEAILGRPELNGEAFCRYLADGAAGEEKCWGLTPLFRDREKIEAMAAWMEAEEQLITQNVGERIARFSSAKVDPCMRAALYVGTGDGGFKLGDTIYLNISTFSCEESLLQTVTHESYHGRERTENVEKQMMQFFQQQDNYIVPILLSMFEEGMADFIGFNGRTTTDYPVLPTGEPNENAEQLKQLLQKYKAGEMSDEELYGAYSRTYYCYTVGAYIADSVWQSWGREGLDLWSVLWDPNAYYDAFLSTPQGAGWPALKL